MGFKTKTKRKIPTRDLTQVKYVTKKKAHVK